MTVSTRGRYALRILIDLAENGHGEYIPMNVVANRQGISLKYLEHILPILKQNGIIEGVQGKGGGYRLVKKPEEYTVGQILRLVEGDLAPVACLECGAKVCERADRCRTVSMWKNLQTIICDYFDGITLKDLMQNSATDLSGIDISFLNSAL